MQPPDTTDLVLGAPHLWPELANARIFLTGATGFFGCWLLETLLFANQHYGLNVQVTALTRNPERFRAKAPHLAHQITLIAGDMQTAALPDGPFTHIVHGAAEVNSDAGLLQGGQRILEIPSQRFLLVSSGAVYSPTRGLIPESTPTNPTTTYGKAKLQLEQHAAERAVIARCFAFLGPYLSLDSGLAAADFLQDALSHRPITIQSNGETRRSYLYAGDLAIWLWTLLLQGTPGRAYNVGSMKIHSVRELAEKLSPTVHTLGTTGGGDYLPDTTRAQQELGLSQTVDLDDAVQRTLAWFKSTPSLPT